MSNAAFSAGNRSQLKRRLRRLVDVTIEALERENEWPRPYSAPLRLRELHSRLNWDNGEEREFARYLHQSGICDALHRTGHTWLWHYEPFGDLFVEQYASRALGIRSYDRKTFDRLFERAWVEITRDRVKLRQVMSVSGMPPPRPRTHAIPAVLTRPYDMNSFGPELWKLLGIEYQRDRVSVAAV